jgi:hypothetical protein
MNKAEKNAPNRILNTFPDRGPGLRQGITATIKKNDTGRRTAGRIIGRFGLSADGPVHAGVEWTSEGAATWIPSGRAVPLVLHQLYASSFVTIQPAAFIATGSTPAFWGLVVKLKTSFFRERLGKHRDSPKAPSVSRESAGIGDCRTLSRKGGWKPPEPSGGDAGPTEKLVAFRVDG